MSSSKWRFWRRRAGQIPAVAEPASSYMTGRGGWAPGAEPAAEPNWNGPARIDDPPILLTLAQRRLYRSEP